jgi:hypothetical protein
MPKSMEFKEFFGLMFKLTKQFNQDGIIISDGEEINLLWQNGSTDLLGKSTTFNKIDQGYSQLRKKPNIPFVFEGTMAPSSNMHRMGLKERGVIWLSQLES